MSHLLHAYVVTVRQKRDSQLQLLGNFDGAGSDLLKVIEAFLIEMRQRDWLDHSINAAARVAEVYAPTAELPDVVAAIVKAGETGLASEIVGTTEDDLGTQVEFRRRLQHAELVPVLVLAKLPGTRDKGFLIMHSPRGRGVKTRFWSAFHEWFANRHPEHIVEIDRCVPEGLYKRLIQEQDVKRVTLLRYLRPQDMTDDDRRWFDTDELGTVRTVIAPRRFGHLRKQDVVAALDDSGTLHSLLVFKGETYDEIRVTVTDGGRDHSINLAGGGMPRAGYDITSDVKVDDNGDPTYDSLRTAALGYLEVLQGGRSDRDGGSTGASED